VLAGRQRRSCVVWPVVGNWKWEGFLHKFRLIVIFHSLTFSLTRKISNDFFLYTLIAINSII
jgi:hypothetical protein